MHEVKKQKGTFNGSVSIPTEFVPVWHSLKSSNRSGIVQLILKTAALCDDPNDIEVILREMYYEKLKAKKAIQQPISTQ